MTPVVGVFQSRSAAGEGIERLLAAGVKREHIHVLTPASSDEQIAEVPVSDSEQPGMGAAVGTLVGGALGSAGGFSAGAALASLPANRVQCPDLRGARPSSNGGIFGPTAACLPWQHAFSPAPDRCRRTRTRRGVLSSRSHRCDGYGRSQSGCRRAIPARD